MWMYDFQDKQIYPVSPSRFLTLAPIEVEYCFWTHEAALQFKQALDNEIDLEQANAARQLRKL